MRHIYEDMHCMQTESWVAFAEARAGETNWLLFESLYHEVGTEAVGNLPGGSAFAEKASVFAGSEFYSHRPGRILLRSFGCVFVLGYPQNVGFPCVSLRGRCLFFDLVMLARYYSTPVD